MVDDQRQFSTKAKLKSESSLECAPSKAGICTL